MTTPNKDRAEFEDWATSENVGVDVRYNSSHVTAARNGYQAACANKNAVIAELVVVMERGIEVSRSGLKVLIADYTAALTKAKESL